MSKFYWKKFLYVKKNIILMLLLLSSLFVYTANKLYQRDVDYSIQIQEDVARVVYETSREFQVLYGDMSEEKVANNKIAQSYQNVIQVGMELSKSVAGKDFSDYVDQWLLWNDVRLKFIEKGGAFVFYDVPVYSQKRVSYFYFYTKRSTVGLQYLQKQTSFADNHNFWKQDYYFYYLSENEEVYWLLLLFAILSVVFTTPLFIQDKEHKSMLQGVPITKTRYLCESTFSSWIFVTGIQLVMVGLFFILSVMKIPFPSMESPVLILYQGQEQIISLGEYIGIFLMYLLFVNLFVVLLVGVFNVLFESELVTLVIVLLGVFIEPLMKMINLEVPLKEWNPFYYLSYGRVVSGAKDFFYKQSTFTIEKGLVSLGISIFLLSMLLIIIYTIKHKLVQSRVYEKLQGRE